MSKSYQPTSDTTAPPPPPIDGGAPDNGVIDRGNDVDNIKEATRQVRERREREWEGGISDDAFAEQNAPTLERQYDGRDRSTKSLRTASKDLSDAHRLERDDAK